MGYDPDRLEPGSNPVLLCAGCVVLDKSFQCLNFIVLIWKNGGGNTYHEGMVVERIGDNRCVSFSQFSCSVVSDSVTPWTVAHQASLPITNSQSLLKLVSIKSVMPSNHLILCHPPSPPAFNLSQNQDLFQCSSHQLAKVLELWFQHQSFQRIFRTDFLLGWLVWSPAVRTQ